MASVPNGVETLPKISIARVRCTNVRPRQTDGRRQITFAKKTIFTISAKTQLLLEATVTDVRNTVGYLPYYTHQLTAEVLQS